jgi:hypothetical protein
MVFDFCGLKLIDYYFSLAIRPNMNTLIVTAKVNIPNCSHVCDCTTPTKAVRADVIRADVIRLLVLI